MYNWTIVLYKLLFLVKVQKYLYCNSLNIIEKTVFIILAKHFWAIPSRKILARTITHSANLLLYNTILYLVICHCFIKVDTLLLLSFFEFYYNWRLSPNVRFVTDLCLLAVKSKLSFVHFLDL